MTDKYVIGLDYGSDSCRALLVNATMGKEITSSVFQYPRWKALKYCDPSKNIFRQHPLDYIEGLEYCITHITKDLSQEIINNIKGISVDTTGSTPALVAENGQPLALHDDFTENPNAMFILWKDHSAIKEAEEITSHAKTWGGVDYTKYCGGIYSSEWYWAKLLKTLRNEPSLKSHTKNFVEHCDWIPALLTGVSHHTDIKRGRCASGHKALWAEDFGGLPKQEFFDGLDPLLSGVNSFFKDTHTSEEPAGTLSQEWAEKLNLSTNVVIGIGAIDAHMGAVGGNIKPHSLVKVIGTSTCDMLITPLKNPNPLVDGICGQVDSSIVSGMLGLEAGQSAFGDVYAWYRNLLFWPLKDVASVSPDVKEKIFDEMFMNLENQAKQIKDEDHTILCLDWINGRRTPYANQHLKGLISGLTLGTNAPAIYRGLIESTSFGAKKIVDQFLKEGIEINEVIAIGGVAKKSPYGMQILADVLNMPVKVTESTQTVALGATIFASKVSGIYKTIEEAQTQIASKFQAEYFPNQTKVNYYNKIYNKYINLGNFIETQT